METKSFATMMARTCIAQFSRSTTTKTSLILLLMMTMFGVQIQAQTYSEISLSDFNPVLISPDNVLDAGESAEFYIQIGTATEPIKNVAGFKLDIELGPDAKIESTINPTVVGWLVSTSKMEESTDPTQPENFNLKYEKSTSATGSGQILKFKVVSTSNQIHASRLVKNVGGIMIIDNLDARMGQFTSTQSEKPKVYPNPSNGHFQLSGHVNDIKEMTLRSIDGSEIKKFAPSNAIDITNVPNGCYLLEITSVNGTQSFQKLIKN